MNKKLEKVINDLAINIIKFYRMTLEYLKN